MLVGDWLIRKIHSKNYLVLSIKLNTVTSHGVGRYLLMKIGSAELLLLVHQLRPNLVKAILGRHGR